MTSMDTKPNGDDLQNNVDTSYVSTSSEKNGTASASGGVTTMIPAARVRTIMRSGPDCVSVSGEAMYAMTRATELFIESLTREAVRNDQLDYDRLAAHVQQSEQLEFLHEIIPNKVRYGDILLRRQNEK